MSRALNVSPRHLAIVADGSRMARRSAAVEGERIMKKLGLVGGLAWISTAEYYSQLYRSIEKGLNGAHALGRPTSFEMSIESLDLQTALSLTGKENDERSWSRFDAYHRDALLRLQKSGVACAAIASNTPHIRYDSIIQGIEVPVIDMFTAVAEEVASRGAKQALILGTPLTMKSDRFKRILSSHGIHAVPVTNEQTISDVFKLIGRLQAGRVQGCAETLDMIVRP